MSNCKKTVDCKKKTSTAIYVTGYSTKGKLDTRLNRWTCTHEQEHIKTLWTNTGLSKNNIDI